MEAVIFCGIQASGKTSFYRERYFDTHVRINGDMLRTAHRERTLVHACLACGQPYVLDKMNLTAAERRRAREQAETAGFRVICCYLESSSRPAIARNAGRPAERRVPVPAILGSHARLEPPVPGEGFDELYRVVIAPVGGFDVERLE